MQHSIIFFADKVNGSVKTGRKGTEYLDGGSVTLGNKTVRTSWLRPDKAQLGKGGLVFANLEVNKRDDKSYPQITITGVVPVVSSENSGYLYGTVTETKEFNKMLTATLRYGHTDWSKETNYATINVKVFDKASPIGEALLKAKSSGGEVLVQVKLDPSNNGFIEFVATKVMPVNGGNGGDDLELSTAGDAPTEEEAPF